MKNRGQQRFASKGSLAQKLIKRIVKLAKSSPIPEKKIAETLSELYEVDQNLSQSLIFAIENLIYSSKNLTAARSLFLNTVSLLSKNDKNQCFDFTYSCDPKAIDKESLEIVFELHLENEHYLASLILLDGLDQNESTQQKRKSIVQARNTGMKRKLTSFIKTLLIYFSGKNRMKN